MGDVPTSGESEYVGAKEVDPALVRCGWILNTINDLRADIKQRTRRSSRTRKDHLRTRRMKWFSTIDHLEGTSISPLQSAVRLSGLPQV